MRIAPMLWLSGCAAFALLAGLAWPERAQMPPRLPTIAVAQAQAAPANATAAARPLMSDAQWHTVHQRLAGTPEGDGELARVVAFIAFQADVHLLAQGEAGSQQRLAQRVAAALPGHLAARELTLGEARAIHGLLQRELGAAAGPEPSASAPDARDQAFVAAQQAAVARWRALPEAARTQEALLTELDALRARHYPETTP